MQIDGPHDESSTEYSLSTKQFSLELRSTNSFTREIKLKLLMAGNNREPNHLAIA